MSTIATYTLGCKVNQYDTEAMLECFEAAGYLAVPFSAAADVYLVNTCTVTGTGDQKSLKTVRRVAREHPECAIVVCGCLAQREAEAIVRMDNVMLVVGVQRRAEVVSLLEKALAENTPINAVGPLKGAAFENLFVSRHEGKTRATMKIQEGCDRYCAYCIIPTVRGPVRSMPLDAVRAEAARLAASGYRELVVTGIHLASYGRGAGDTLLDAIRAVHDAPGVDRVRLEPVVVTEAFARTLSQLPGIMRQFHLSLQSGSATVLKRMRRRYTPEEYRAAVDTLRRYMPDCAVTTDVIAGFPGETEAEFQETADFIQSVRLARVHVFPYSRRSGTVADAMPDQVPEALKRERARQLIAIGNRLERDYVSSMLGTVQPVLFEQPAGDPEQGLAEGYTGQYIRVRAKAAPGELANVRLIRAEDTLAFGERCE